MSKYRVNLQFTVDVYASTKDEAWELVVDEIDPIKHWYDEADRRITIVDDLDAEFDPINEADDLIDDGDYCAICGRAFCESITHN